MKFLKLYEMMVFIGVKKKFAKMENANFSNLQLQILQILQICKNGNFKKKNIFLPKHNN